MKKFLLTAFLCIGLCSMPLSAQEKQELIINESTVIKDTKGEQIDLFKFMDLMNSGEWMADPVMDSDGKTNYIQLRKATEEEKKMMMEGMASKANADEMIGQKAPEFELNDIEGNRISPKAMKGKVVVLNFWFAACKPCIAEIPDLNEVYDTYKNHPDVIFAAITFDYKDTVHSFLKKHPLKYPVVANAMSLNKTFKVTSFPANIVIDRQGNYTGRTFGSFPNIGNHITKTVQKALDSK